MLILYPGGVRVNADSAVYSDLSSFYLVDTISEVSGKRRQTTMVTYGNDSSRGEDTCCTNNEQSPIKRITQEVR
jgi:hypothetical protein